MLRLRTPTGSLELTAEEERQVRGMSDWELCVALNRTAQLHHFAAVSERPNLLFAPRRGWIVTTPKRPSALTQEPRI